MSPQISVVIPVFNRPAAVRRAIDSVLSQTCQDFEIIVVDDGSADDTAKVISAFKDPRVKLIVHDRNRGGSAARNTGIRHSSAPYIAFLDSDDEWLPTKLERQLEIFERSDDQLGLVYAGTERVGADGTIWKEFARRHDNLALRLLTVNVIGETSVGMVRRSALDAIGGFDETLPAAQDLDLWLRLSERFGAEVVPDILVRIAKGRDPGRISADAARSSRGRELFLRKHAQKMKRHRVLHLFWRDLGWMDLRFGRNPVLARRRYLASLTIEPLAPLTCVMLIMTCLPMSWLDMLAKLKHRITALLESLRSPIGART